MRSGNGLAVLLIAFGALLILGKIGLGIGFLFSLLIPILIIALGAMAWKNGSKLLGGVVVIIGGMILVGKLSFLFVWIAAIALILFGLSMFGRNPRTRI